MRRVCHIGLAALFGALLAVHPKAAHANGRFPTADHLVVAPSDPAFMVLRSTFGILTSSNHGADWDWTCEKAVGYGGLEDPSTGVTADKTILVGFFGGLGISKNIGCDWSLAGGGLDKQYVVDLVVRPDAPHSSLVLTSQYSSADDAGKALFDTGVYSSTDDGATWTKLSGLIDQTLVAETIEVAASDPNRIYISAVRGTGNDAKGVVLVSVDAGATWTEHAVLLDTPTERAPFIAAVDAHNAQRVYVRTSAASGLPNRLLVTDDGGATFRVIFTGLGEMLGFALLDDSAGSGSKVYVGGPQDGLNVASSADFVFKKTSPIQVQCLVGQGSTLYACSNEVSGFILGASNDDGAHFTPLLHLSTIRGPLACAANSSEAMCVSDWPVLCQSLGGCLEDAGPDGDASMPSPPPQLSGGGGCMEATGTRATATLAGSLAVALTITIAARRRRRSRS